MASKVSVTEADPKQMEMNDLVETLYRQTGSGSATRPLGFYQKLFIVILIASLNTGGFFFYGLFYWEKIPEY